MLPALKNLWDRNISVLDIAHLIWKTFKYGGSLDFLHASIIHDGTLNKKVSKEIYVVQSSVNYNMPFFNVSQILLDNFLSYSLIS